MRLPAFLTSALSYSAWAVFAVATYVVTWFIDPYVFGFAVLGVGTASGVVCITGCIVALRSGDPARRRNVAALVILIGAATIAALRMVKAIHWA